MQRMREMALEGFIYFARIYFNPLKTNKLLRIKLFFFMFGLLTKKMKNET